MGVSKVHSRAGKLCKVAENLYRYSSNGIYYSVFRDKGKLKWKSLKTADRALAKRRLPAEIEKARRIEPKAEMMTLNGLLDIYQQNLKTLDTKTIETREMPDFDVPPPILSNEQVARLLATTLEMDNGSPSSPATPGACQPAPAALPVTAAAPPPAEPSLREKFEAIPLGSGKERVAFYRQHQTELDAAMKVEAAKPHQPKKTGKAIVDQMNAMEPSARTEFYRANFKEINAAIEKE